MQCLRRTGAQVRLRMTFLITAGAALVFAALQVCAQDKPASSSTGQQIAKALGTIKSMQADSITVTGSGGDIAAKLSPATKILSVAPGAKDLKSAVPLQAKDLKIGDSVRVRGYGDGAGINALEVIVFKQAEMAAKQQHDREDWQKRGVAGPVTAVDIATGTITISSGGLGPKRSIVIHVGKDTILRRYAPGSANFDSATPAPFNQIKVGDQLNARGTRSSDGSEISAEEVVSGTFDYIEGTIKSVDAANNTMTVQDPVRKSAVVVKMSPDSLMKKLPPEMAQRIAMQLKGSAGGEDKPAANGQAQATSGHEGTGASASGGQHRQGAPDFQHILSSLPNSTLADLQKDDAVMIVAAASGDSGPLTAIKVLAGVDVILRAAPNRSASSLLSSWSLSASGGEGDAAQ